jgi:DNA repair protein RadA/Sms
MSKVKTIYACHSCGATFPKWQGKCNACGEWNTLVEEVIERGREVSSSLGISSKKEGRIIAIQDIVAGENIRIVSPDKELNRVLGGGIVPGALILIGGHPGIGKSTLLLQLALQMEGKILYNSGEESAEQIKMRADRIGIHNQQCYVMNSSSVEEIVDRARRDLPGLLIVDSIQTVYSNKLESTPGSISQLRECTSLFQELAKTFHIPTILVGHITKEGSIAGPKVLEHIVDTVLQFEGDQNYAYRILRTLKNRFGSTDELGIYEMTARGMREVSNPSELLLSQTEDNLSGSAIAASIEGMRPMLIETQALVSRSVYGTPQRSATGYDQKRLNMLLAVLEKKMSYPFAVHDVFLNIAGGLKVSDPAMDLPIAASLISSLEDIPISNKFAFAAEIGLTGEIRAITRIEPRIQEASRLGFDKLFISKFNAKGLDLGRFPIEIITLSKLQDLTHHLF